jgi:hypothetical protein
VNTDDRNEEQRHDGDYGKESKHQSRLSPASFTLRRRETYAHCSIPYYRPITRPGSADSPALPEKIELVSEGTSNTPTVNVIRIMTA